MREAHQNGIERMRSSSESQVIGKIIELHGLKKSGIEFSLVVRYSRDKGGLKMDRRLTVILVTDVVGFSRLMGEDESGTLRWPEAPHGSIMGLALEETHE